MTTATKPRPRKSRKSALPPSAGVTTVAGRDFIVMPLDDFEEWQEDLALSALMKERIESGEDLLPFEEIEARLDCKAKNRK